MDIFKSLLYDIYSNARLSVPANSWNWDYPHSTLLYHAAAWNMKQNDILAHCDRFGHISIKVGQILY